MAKKRRLKPVEVKYSIELSYVSTFFKERDSNGCDYDVPGEPERAKKAHTDIIDKKIMRSSIRSNISVCFNTTNKTLGEIIEEVEVVKNSQEYNDLFVLGNKISQIVMDETDMFFPDLERTTPFIFENNWFDKLVFDKKDLQYRTNIFNHMRVDQWDMEFRILDILQEMVDRGLSKYVKMSMHYNCWNYYIGNNSSYSLQEFIDHRRENLELK